ncbi:MAG: DUF4982 domain-containing protein [Porphyromonadaceae bacterium]|nr:DUF4982 domain-containing protein [Porphyromonadaceae bacterium]
MALFVTAQTRQEIYLEKGWRFSKGDFPQAADPSFDDSRWETVEVPHDWAIFGPFDEEIDKQVVAIEQNGEKIATEKTGRTGSLPYIGVGWYRTTFTVPQGRRAILAFDGAMSQPRVYLNGEEVGHWAYGYTPFYIDVTPYLTDGENLLAVRLDNLSESSRWYPGAGLYRPVRLILTGDIAIAMWGVRVTTPVITAQNAIVQVDAELENTAGHNLNVSTVIYDASGKPLAHSEAQEIYFDGTTTTRLTVTNPRLWSPESPELYTATVSIQENGTLLDEYTTRFGIRSIEITPEKGFVLNGVPRKIKGVCLHHDLGPLGTALNKAALRRQLLILKEMGCDAIRTSHNIPAPWQMDLCDEMGMMVMAESFDEWTRSKCKNGYNLFFQEWAEKDLVNLIRCHRNHPSIIMWSIGNEVSEQYSQGGGKIAKFLQDICHREDPTRLVTSAMNRPDEAIKNQMATVLDIPGINYQLDRYEDSYKRLPQGFILGSETASTISSRGVYKLPAERAKGKTYPDGQCSSYDMESASWSNLPDDDWAMQEDLPWVIGEFVWTGFDYLGEPTPYDEYWPSRSSYFGICDLAGLPKDRYYLYRSHWNTQSPTLHLLPHWNWEGHEGDTSPFYCYTSYPSAELFVNGQSQGRISKDPTSQYDRFRLRWNDVVYEPGTLKVVAYDAAGNAAAEEEIHTASKPHHLTLTADRTELVANGKDLAFITVQAVDKDGNPCPLADNALRFSVKGAGEYRAACNGDATSTELFHLPTMKLFYGQLVVVVRTHEEAGPITLSVSGKGLKTAQIVLNSK